MIYNDLVEQLFFDLDHAGLDDWVKADIHLTVSNTTKSQIIEFHLVMQSHGDIEAVRYLVKGNPFTMAGAEWIARSLEKQRNGTILNTMNPFFWSELLAIPKLDKQTAIFLSQAAQALSEKIK